jgi:hypothetical protein
LSQNWTKLLKQSSEKKTKNRGQTILARGLLWPTAHLFHADGPQPAHVFSLRAARGVALRPAVCGPWPISARPIRLWPSDVDRMDLRAPRQIKTGPERCPRQTLARPTMATRAAVVAFPSPLLLFTLFHRRPPSRERRKTRRSSLPLRAGDDGLVVPSSAQRPAASLCPRRGKSLRLWRSSCAPATAHVLLSTPRHADARRI